MITINEALVLAKAVRERLNGLRALRSQVSVKERFYGNVEKTVEPQYDVKVVDKKISELELFLLDVDTRIKRSNAVTQIELNIDAGKLLEPLV